MDTYDPDIAPDPESWLEMDEAERMVLVLDYHEEAGDDVPKLRIHAAIHLIVENQLAMNYGSVAATLARLIAQDDLGRHEAVHAIGAVLAELLFDRMRGAGKVDFDGADYEEGLRTLTAGTWRERYGTPE
jgi:hypothetical protein